ncbi:MAG: 50S ribosomal protein L6 [Patescibacteria group bacterium]
MSRIGKTPIQLPSDVTVTIDADTVLVKGPKGELRAPFFDNLDIKIEDGEVSVLRSGNDAQTKAFHGLVRSVINNHIIGVTEGYKKTLKLVGTGYRVQAKGRDLSLAVGYSHPVEFKGTEGVTLTVEGNDTIIVSGMDKHLVGQAASDIRKVKPPEPYLGKGIRYEDEVVRRKQGKAAA